MLKCKIKISKNIILLLSSIGLASILYISSLFIVVNLIKKNIPNDFNTKKMELYEQIIHPYQTVVNKIEQITPYYYQSYNSSILKPHLETILKCYPFISKINFFDLDVYSKSHNIINFDIKKSYRSSSVNKKIEQTQNIFSQEEKHSFLTLLNFKSNTLTNSNTLVFLFLKKQEEINPNKINFLYLSKYIPHNRTRTYKLITLYINPKNIVIKNTYKDFYKNIILTSANNESNIQKDKYITDITLPGALASHKLYFSTSPKQIKAISLKKNIPNILFITAIYICILIITLLIYQNIQANHDLLTLQDDLINNLTHEFKSPITIIKLAGDNLLNINNISDDDKKRYGVLLNREADRLNNLINKLLSFNQIEKRSIQITKKKINLTDFCNQLSEFCILKYPDLFVDFDVRITDAYVSDETLLTVIFQNLIDNAYKYSHKGNKKIEINIYQDWKHIYFKFTDNGIGIPKKDFDNIFKKFYRLDNEYNQNGSAGIGLALCKETVILLGGNIKVSSTVNIGTTFTITFEK